MKKSTKYNSAMCMLNHFKEKLIKTYSKLGGIDWLVKVAEKHPVYFLRVLASLVPKGVEEEVDSQGKKYGGIYVPNGNIAEPDPPKKLSCR